jgi:hypothetical protein
MMTLREDQTRLTRFILLCDLHLALHPFQVFKSRPLCPYQHWLAEMHKALLTSPASGDDR